MTDRIHYDGKPHYSTYGATFHKNTEPTPESTILSLEQRMNYRNLATEAVKAHYAKHGIVDPPVTHNPIIDEAIKICRDIAYEELKAQADQTASAYRAYIERLNTEKI